MASSLVQPMLRQQGPNQLPQLLSRLSGLIANPPAAAEPGGDPPASRALLAPLVRFQQAMQQEQQEQVRPCAWRWKLL